MKVIMKVRVHTYIQIYIYKRSKCGQIIYDDESHDETITVFTKLVIACYSLLIIG